MSEQVFSSSHLRLAHLRPAQVVKAAEWPLVCAVALAWSALLRGRYLHFAAIDGDEALFLLIGKAWLAGHPPYTVIWDLKPPGLFLIYAGVAALFHDDLAGPKIASLAAVAATSVALYAFAARFLKSRPTGLAAILLYAPATLVLGGLGSKPDLLMTPFIAWGAVAALASAQAGEGARRGLVAAAAGVLLGCAGMVKQTAVFEAACFGLVLVWADRGPGRRGLAYAAGCAAAPAAFAAWFASQGLLLPLVRACVVSASERVNRDEAALLTAPLRLLALSAPVLPLVVGAAMLWVERRRLASAELRRGLGFAATWILASAIGVLAASALYEAYMQPLLPPLALLAASFLVLAPWPLVHGRARAAVAAALALVAVAVPVLMLRASPTARFLHTQLPQQVAAYLRSGPVAPGEAIYVVDYEPAVYLLADAAIPTRFVLPLHVLCPFPAAHLRSDQEITQIMSRAPRCLVVSATRSRILCAAPDLARLPEQLGGARYSIRRRFSDGAEAVDVLCRPRSGA